MPPSMPTAGRVDELFAEFEVRAVDLDTGEYVDIDIADYDPIKAAKVPGRIPQTDR